MGGAGFGNKGRVSAWKSSREVTLAVGRTGTENGSSEKEGVIVRANWKKGRKLRKTIFV